ncbi:MAG: ABC transporter substrate-binding protein, partial [Candidatus Dormibacteraceae bacterium]
MTLFGGRQVPGKVLLGCLAALVLVLASCGNASGSSASPGKASDTISWAEPPGNTPDWIWPFMPAAKESNMNISVQFMLYRPLYFFGAGGTPTVSSNLSLAQMPSYSADGKTLTITLKSYKWSNGQPVTAQDVLFWINMYRAEPTNYYDYTPGLFPDNVVSATAPNPSTVVLTTNQAYNPKWFLYNQLSTITPMPAAWDVTGPGQASDCATNEADCAAVYNYLDGQSKNLPGYSSNPVWAIVDGPWKLQNFNSDGNLTFLPNPSYSGPVKASVKQLKMLPFTTDSAEFNVLKSGKTIDVGYLPTQDVSQPRPANSAADAAGPNPLSGYTMAPWFLYGFNFFVINFNNPTVGPIFKQLYVRQALQSLVNQEGIIKSSAKNYGIPSTGPIPQFPQSPEISSVEKQNPYPFSVSKAKQYLSSNGWDVKAGGTTTCAKPGTAAGDCGAGISQGEALSFQMLYLSGSQTTQTAMETLKSNASQVGMQLAIKSAPFDTVITDSNACSGPTCTWQMGNWGGGWSYGPDFYPTGESLFATGAASNSGSYSDPTMDQLIKATLTNSDTSKLIAYENAAAKDLPVIYQPQYT